MNDPFSLLMVLGFGVLEHYGCRVSSEYVHLIGLEVPCE